ncbi:DNA repair protein RecN [Pseudoclavibacter helvolus]
MARTRTRMILDIDISGLGVIERAELPLGPGFTAITGETGAGKTMIVTALGLLRGGRASADAVRSGASKAVVEGRWQLNVDSPAARLAADAGAELDENDELLVARQVSAEGRSRAWLGGRGVPASILADLGERLVVVHGQSDQWRLRSEGAQRAALDAFGGVDLRTARGAVREAHVRRGELRSELQTLSDAEAERELEAARLRRALADIEPAEPQSGEDVSLLTRIERLSNLEALRRDVGQAHELLAGDSSAGFGGQGGASSTELVSQVRALIDSATSSDPALGELGQAAADISFAIDELGLRLASYLDGLESEGSGELAQLNERLTLLTSLTRTYGPTLDDVIELGSQAGMQLLELENDTTRIQELETQIAEAEATLAAAAAHLTGLRTATASVLEERVTHELHALAMPAAQLTVEISPLDEIAAHGGDRVAFMLRPHPGTEPAPLGKGASGGELSRVMLALEVVLADVSSVPTLVFDEVDAGVGGSAAIEIGRRLQRLSANAQVIVVTHLAQVAAFSDNHISIEKSSDGQFTTSSIRQIRGADRTQEIARLLSGLSESETGNAHAEELLELGAANRTAPGADGSRSVV